jgi:hypothetical protein
MTPRISILLAACLIAAAVGCGDDGADGDPTSSSGGSGNVGNEGGSGAAGASSAGGMGSSNGGSGGAGATGGAGTGGSPGEATVEMTVTPDTVAAGGTVKATITVTNFVLEAPVNQPNEDGHGHFHIYLDGAMGGSYLVADQVPMVDVEIPASTAPGPHTLRVSLGENSHAPVIPAVEDIVDITVE